ncbi:hypothetical protein HY251_13140 [bacterium]|nr:hypothetical protein [bacterium]
MDDELQALARERRKDPEDGALLLRQARALVRKGSREEAERALVSALDRSPGDPAPTRELDALTGGRAPLAPWPSPRGDPGLTGRSCARGPTRGEVVLRRELGLEGAIEPGGFAVASPGRALVLTRSALFLVTDAGDTELVRKLPLGVELSSLVLLPGKRILAIGPTQARVFLPGKDTLARPVPGIFSPEREPDRAQVVHHYSHSFRFAAGSSGLLYAASKQGTLVAFPLALPSEGRAIQRTESRRAAIALAPGGDLLLVREGSPEQGRAARLERIGPAGELRFSVELAPRALTNMVTGPVVDAEGSAYMAIPGASLTAHDASGKKIFDRRYVGEPVALAGEAGDILVIRERNTLGLVDRRSGAELATWGGAWFGSPKVDARGWIYVRRDDDLVAWDPRSPGAPAFEVQVAIRGWDFAFSGNGRAIAFARSGSANELVVIE